MNVAVIFAGGVGSRLTTRSKPKQFLESNGKPIIIHTLDWFQEHNEIDAIAVIMVAEYMDYMKKLVDKYNMSKVRWLVEGGQTGQESRHKGLKAVAADCPPDTVVLLHDGVRPLINEEIISSNISSVLKYGSAITCVKCNETIIESTPDMSINKVFPREELYIAQAPQSFRLGTILELYDRAVAEGITDSIDSCTLMYKYGKPIHRVDGIRSNIKITTAEDFYIFRTFCQIIENQQIAGL